MGRVRRGHACVPADRARRQEALGRAAGRRAADNMRARRYVAKYTICPRLAHGLDGESAVDVVSWPDLVLGSRRSSGAPLRWCSRRLHRLGAMATRTPPSRPRSRAAPAMFGASPEGARHVRALSWPRRAVRRLPIWPNRLGAAGLVRRGHPRRPQVRPAQQRRAARIEVDPETFTVRIDGEVVEEAPQVELPMAQRYFLF